MSAGRFSRTRYQASYATGAIHPIRLQPETIAFATVGGTPQANDPPGGAITNPISALATLGMRARGLRPRSVNIILAEGSTPPTGYAPGATARIPILQESLFDNLNAGDEVSYLGTTWEVVGRSPEEAS